jgi:hypothetical protein
MILDTTLGAVRRIEKPTSRRSAVADDHAAWRARRATDRERALDRRLARPGHHGRTAAAEGAQAAR